MDDPIKEKPCILVVDDEDVVRDLTATLLRSLGYEAVTAANGSEALVQFRAHADRVQLVILDLTMPDMSGEECFRALRKIDGRVRVVLMSGYVIGREMDEPGFGTCGILQKPFRINELSAVVKKALQKS